MDDLNRRLAALSPEQRELLALKLRKQGSPLVFPPAPAGAADAGWRDEKSRVARGVAGGVSRQTKGMEFSLFFFSADGSKEEGDKYRLLLESARFADRHGFSAVWTPERHFQDFGGLYPNPAVLGAALATITERIQIRAGSVALPLHNPIRVAEEWSVVDNLSKGRVGVSFASGWHSQDFVLSPGSYENRKEIMFSHIQTVQKLWAGEELTFKGVGGRDVELKILPRPVQPRLPVWVTIAGNPETWARTGEIGAHVLTGLQGQPIPDLAWKTALYRDNLARHGHDPQSGKVAVMLHTFLGVNDDAVKAKVRGPLAGYLQTFMAQSRTTPTPEGQTALHSLSEQDQQTLALLAFEHYFATSSLLGTPAKCAQMVERLQEAGVDEIACLIDFGLDLDSVMDGLHYLNELKEQYSPACAAALAATAE
jgi:natural product biosynthesis luciferase-like monooxygenase protein